MIQPAKLVTPSAYPADAPVCYEQPLGERMRTFLRLEYLYQQLIAHLEQQSSWSTRMAVTSLLDIIAILTRGDLRGDILKELEHRIYAYNRYQSTPNVDENKVEGILQSLKALRENLNFVGNIEGRDVLRHAADVVIADGYVGNIMLKFGESVATVVPQMIAAEMNKIGMAPEDQQIVGRALKGVRDRFDFQEYLLTVGNAAHFLERKTVHTVLASQ